MSTASYRFNVGAFECTAISDGAFTYTPPMFPPPAHFLFSNAPKERLELVLGEHQLPPEQWVEWISPYICLLVKTGRHHVLVDTGAGNLGPNTGQLLHNLQAEGITPADVDMVILTHGHPDHIGGNTYAGKPAFPHARYVIWKSEWDFWTSDLAEQQADAHIKPLFTFARENLPSIQRQLALVDEETEIAPGIHAIAASGHTPGHMALAISSEGKQLLCIADAVLHPIHVEQPNWVGAVDFAPQQVVTTRRQLLNQAVNNNALVLAFHFPFPGLGYILQRGEEWQWQSMHRNP